MTQSSAAAKGVPSSAVPIICNPHVLGREVLVRQVELNMNIRVRWPKAKKKLDDGYLFEYEGDEELFVTLAKYAADEHRCCPWIAFSVQVHPFQGQGRVQLKMTAEGKEAQVYLLQETQFWDEWLTKEDEDIDYQRMSEGFMALFGPMADKQRMQAMRTDGTLNEAIKTKR